MADFLDNVLKKLAPLHLRTFGKTLIGDRSDITEENMTEEEKRKLALAVIQSTGNVDSKQYKRIQGTSYLPGADPAIRSTFGSFAAVPQKDGSTLVEDRYDFWPNDKKALPVKPGKYEEPLGNRAQQVRAQQGRAGVGERLSAVAELLRLAVAGEDDPGDELPNLALNGATRNVRVKLDAALIKAAQKEMERTRRPAPSMKTSEGMKFDIQTKKFVPTAEYNAKYGNESNLVEIVPGKEWAAKGSDKHKAWLAKQKTAKKSILDEDS